MPPARRTRSAQNHRSARLLTLLLAGCGTSPAPSADRAGGAAGQSGATSAGAEGVIAAGAPMLGDAGSSGSGGGLGGTSGATGGSGSVNGAGRGTADPSGGRDGNIGGNSSAGNSSAGNNSAGNNSSAGGGGAAHSGPWHIMPFGDSITGTTCYPQLLSKKLKDAGRTNFDFIGSNLNNQACNGAPNVQTEGHGGYLVTYLVDDTPKPMGNKGSLRELNQWLEKTPAPDVILLQHGTNDVWNSVSPAAITSAYSFVLEKARAKNPSLIVFVAKILPMHPNGCADASSSCENNRVKALNAAIPGWAAEASTAASPVYVVDVYGSVNADEFKPNSALTSDGVHPNLAGSENVAQAWYDALTERGIP